MPITYDLEGVLQEDELTPAERVELGLDPSPLDDALAAVSAAQTFDDLRDATVAYLTLLKPPT